MSPDSVMHGKVAIVTGASGGLGARFARVLHALGADVVASARREDRLNALAQELGHRVHVLPCDLSSEADRERLITGTADRFGSIDVLVNNAGRGQSVPAEDEDLDSFREMLEVNLVAVFHLCQLAGRAMLSQGSGTIINVGSIFGLVAAAPLPQAGYCATKGGVANLTRELAAQWASRGVRVNTLAPGWFPTEMNDAMWDDDRSSAYVERNTPMRRIGRVEELDAALEFLVRDDNGFFTGQTLTVDGGWTAR